MYQVQYKDRTYSGETEKEVMLNLRKIERLSLPLIGKLMGVSKQRVSELIGNVGRLTFPELMLPETFNEADEVVALRLGIPVSKVATARRKLGLKALPKVDVEARRKRLSQYLFSRDPGPEFVTFIEKHLEQLHEGRARVLREFYIEGKSISFADNLNTDTDRTYRAIARQKLLELVKNYDVEQLVKEEVLNGDN